VPERVRERGLALAIRLIARLVDDGRATRGRPREDLRHVVDLEHDLVRTIRRRQAPPGADLRDDHLRRRATG
jgi:hypothetical protein